MATKQEQAAAATAARRSRRTTRVVESESEDEEEEDESEEEATAPPPARATRGNGGSATNGGRRQSQPSKKKQGAAPAFNYEFGGPWGALGIIVGLPVVVLGLCFFCPNEARGMDGTESLRWTDVVRFLTATLPATLMAWAEGAKHVDVPALASGAAWAKGLPQAAEAGARALWAFVAEELWDTQAFLCVCGWFAFQVLLERVLPGEVALGVPISRAGGQRLAYKLNGHLAFWVSLLVMGHAYPRFASPAASAVPAAAAGVTEALADAAEGAAEAAAAAAAAAATNEDAAIPVVGQLLGFGAFPMAQLYDRYPQFAFAALVLSFLLAVGLYLASFRHGAVLAEGGESGNPVYDFYIGRELNPRTGSFDWKYFCELRPGLIGWVVLNLGMLCAQHERHGGAFNAPLALVNVFQAWYVLDALVNERAILTTMDITTDGFGFMLAFGDLAWVPFTYSLQVRSLVYHPCVPFLSSASPNGRPALTPHPPHHTTPPPTTTRPATSWGATPGGAATRWRRSRGCTCWATGSSARPTRPRTRSGGIRRASRTSSTSRRSAAPSSWSRGGGAGRARSTTRATGSCPSPGASSAGPRTCSPTSTASTSASSLRTAPRGTTTSARSSTAPTGTATRRRCPRSSCPASIEGTRWGLGTVIGIGD